MKRIVIPASLTRIGDCLFADCESLTSIVIPASVTDIDDSAFDCCDELTIKGYAGSYAETYAKENGIPFEVIDEEIK